MNDDTRTNDMRSGERERVERREPVVQAQFDEQLRWICLELMAQLEVRPPTARTHTVRQLVMYMANRYSGLESERFERLCGGLYRMDERDFRAALAEFEVVLAGQVETDFESVREMALEAHGMCLRELNYDDEALEDFTRLLHRKFEETRDNGEADHIAMLLGLTRLAGGKPRRKAFRV